MHIVSETVMLVFSISEMKNILKLIILVFCIYIIYIY